MNELKGLVLDVLHVKRAFCKGRLVSAAIMS